MAASIQSTCVGINHDRALCARRAAAAELLAPLPLTGVPYPRSPQSYEENTYTLGTTSTVEDFWRLYVHLRRPVDERPTVCDYHVFREGIRPMWEDEANVNGGKWIVRLKKGLAARYWEDVVSASAQPRMRSGACTRSGACAARDLHR